MIKSQKNCENLDILHKKLKVTVQISVAHAQIFTSGDKISNSNLGIIYVYVIYLNICFDRKT